MPFLYSDQVCKKCGESGKLFRNKFHKINQKFYLQSTCKDCETRATKLHQLHNKDKWAEYNHKWYMKNSAGVSRRNNMNHSPETKAQWYRDKANARCSRAKQARFLDEFTKFVTKEAHELRKLRNHYTNFEWHVDHIIPLRGVKVCGLHIWSNLAVIPKVENLRKGNKNSIYA